MSKTTKEMTALEVLAQIRELQDKVPMPWNKRKRTAEAKRFEEQLDELEALYIKKLKTEYKGVYVIDYKVIGSRCSGMYMIKAKDKREARRSAKQISSDYVPYCVWSLAEYHIDGGVGVEEDDLQNAPTELGQTFWISAGT